MTVCTGERWEQSTPDAPDAPDCPMCLDVIAAQLRHAGGER